MWGEVNKVGGKKDKIWSNNQYKFEGKKNIPVWTEMKINRRMF